MCNEWKEFKTALSESSLGIPFLELARDSQDDDNVPLSCFPRVSQDINLSILHFSSEEEKELLYLQMAPFWSTKMSGQSI